jgi:hypothetical protein
MTIYDIQSLSERVVKNFKPTRLYIKELFGIKYFGKTSCKNVESYSGSGVIWKKRIKKYGKENIRTLWISDWYHDPYEIQKVALDFSRENQIVESNEWANLWAENGINGGKTRDESVNKGKMTVVDQNGNTYLLSKNSSLIHDNLVKSVNKGTIGVIDLSTNITQRVTLKEFYSNRQKFRTLTEGKSLKKSDGLPHGLKGKITVKDSVGNTIKVNINDERVLSGELKPLLLGRVNVIDSDGNPLSVSVNDPRYISGEYKFSGGPKKGYKQQIVTCCYCGITGGKSNLSRHHFDNCKAKS